GRVRGRLCRSARDLFVVATGGVLLAALGSGDDRDPYRPLALPWAPDGAVGHGLTWLAERVRSLPNAYHGLRFQVEHNRAGHGGTYLLGQARLGSFWFYFPVALTI